MKSTVRKRYPWDIARRRGGIMGPFRGHPWKYKSLKMKAQARARHGHPATFIDSDGIQAMIFRRTGEDAKARYLEIRSKLSCIASFNRSKVHRFFRARPWFLIRMREDKIFCRKCGAQISCHIEGECPPDPFAEPAV